MTKLRNLWRDHTARAWVIAVVELLVVGGALWIAFRIVEGVTR